MPSCIVRKFLGYVTKCRKQSGGDKKFFAGEDAIASTSSGLTVDTTTTSLTYGTDSSLVRVLYSSDEEYEEHVRRRRNSATHMSGLILMGKLEKASLHLCAAHDNLSSSLQYVTDVLKEISARRSQGNTQKVKLCRKEVVRFFDLKEFIRSLLLEMSDMLEKIHPDFEKSHEAVFIQIRTSMRVVDSAEVNFTLVLDCLLTVLKM